jgi:hypothetical protein
METPVGQPQPAAERRRTAAVVEDTLAALRRDDDQAAADLAGIGEVIDALAATSAPSTRAELLTAARTFERATRSHARAERAERRALRTAARGIIRAGTALGRGEDGGATAMVLSTLVLATLAAARWHTARGHAQQAAAARQAADHLRAAAHKAGATPMKALRRQGQQLPALDRRRHHTTIRTVLQDAPTKPHLQNPMNALAATLATAEAAGHDPQELLQKAMDLRELDTAKSIEEVLVWRIRRLTDLPTDADRRARTTERRTPDHTAGRTSVPTIDQPRRHRPGR